jgi:hypothetical protein
MCGAVFMALHGCNATHEHATVKVPDPAQTDAATAGDAATASDAAAEAPDANPRGPTSRWPAAEAEAELPYRDSERSIDLVLEPNPSMLDVLFDVDTTASFGGEIDEMQIELSRTIIPQLLARVPNTQFGVARFADFPISPFGRSTDLPFTLLCPITDSLVLVTNAVQKLDHPLGDGADVPEAGAEALYQIATGAGYMLPGERTPLIAPFPTETGAALSGGAGFRSQALKVVVHITDAPSHTPDDYAAAGILQTHDWDDARSAMQALGARVIGICSTEPGTSLYDRVRSELSEVARATGARTDAVSGECATGIDGSSLPTFDGTCPLVFDVAGDGSGLASSIVDAVVNLVDGVHFSEVHAEPGSDPLGFIERVELDVLRQSAGVSAPVTADRRPSLAPDGVLDTYLDVSRKQQLGFRVLLKNDRIAGSDVPQTFRVSVRLVGDGVLLEERFLRVLVPAGPPPSAADEDAGH